METQISLGITAVCLYMIVTMSWGLDKSQNLCYHGS